jgi:hypothetical protein
MTIPSYLLIQRRSVNMVSYRETYEGFEIDIEDDTKLTINGKEIDYEYDNVENKWSSRYLPYSRYDSLLDLAQAIARDTAEFISKK